MKNSKPTIYDPAFLPNNIYSGVPSWLNLPVLENESELSSMDAVVTGVPWEGGCTIGGYYESVYRSEKGNRRQKPGNRISVKEQGW